MNVDRPNAGVAIGRAVLAAAAFLVVVIALGLFFLNTEAGQRLDASTFGAVVPLRDLLGGSADEARLVLPAIAAAIAFVVLVIALVRRRWRAIAYSAALVVAAWAVSTVLKSVLIERPALGEYGYPWNSFPSGHAAVSIAALVAVLWLLPRPPVLLVVPLALLGGLAAASQVVSYAHRLSDVLAGVLLVGVLTAVGLGRSGRLGRLARGLLWGGVLLAAVAGVLLILAWETSGYGSAERWPTTIGIALCSTAAAGAVLIVALEGTRHRPA